MKNKNYTINKNSEKEIVWNSSWHLALADIHMDAEDNISCYDGCKEMAQSLFNNDPKEAIKMIKEK